MGGRSYVLEEATLGAIRGFDVEVAILPWGATEPHNLHLPFGTDSIQVAAVAKEVARICWEDGTRVVVLPTIPVGVNTQQLGISLALNLNPSTQAKILDDLVESLSACRVPKLVILNGHGGNDFRQMIRELQPKTSVFLCTANWYTAVESEEFFEKAGDHAGELETSVMLHLVPDLVQPLEQAGPGEAKTFKVRGLREGVAWAPRDWASVTVDTGVGDPSAATDDKGRSFFEAVTKALAAFVTDLAAVDLDEMYESAHLQSSET